MGVTMPTVPAASMDWPTTTLDWAPAYRIIPTRFPAVNLFDRVASADDFDALYALESLTNDRIRNEVGILDLVPSGERRYGLGWGPIMAAFTHLNPQGSRFSDGSYGVFYCARSRDTAIAETRHHSSLFLAATQEPPMRQQMRLYTVVAQGEVADVRAWRRRDPALLDPVHYGVAQTLAAWCATREAQESSIRRFVIRKENASRRSARPCCAIVITRPISSTTGTARPSTRYSN